MVQKSAAIKGLLVVVACVAIIAYLKPSSSTRIPEREVETMTFLPLSSVTQQSASATPRTDSLVASDDKGGDWFVIGNYTGKCEKDEGPAKTMEKFKAAEIPYEVKDDVVEAGKPMQVRVVVHDGVESMQAVFYRGKARCQEQLDKKKQATDTGLNRYK